VFERCSICKIENLEYLKCSHGHINCKTCFLKSVKNTIPGIEIKCMYKEKPKPNNLKNNKNIEAINGIECEGIFDKRKYMEIISWTNLERIFEEDHDKIKNICENNKKYCPFCYEWIFEKDSQKCNNCKHSFCKNHKLILCPYCNKNF
jgi:hypothetical protein